MSQSVSFASYRAALSTPAARLPVLAALLGRLPVAMVGLALMLYVRQSTGSFASAGLVSAGALTGAAIGSVLQGRLVDRFGPTRPLLTAAALLTLFTTLGVTAVESGAPVWLLMTIALALGVSQPSVSSSSRSLWSRLLPPGPARQAAYSYEAISMEVFFILGPAIAGLLMALPWPGTGVVIGAGSMVIGAVGFALTPAVRAWRERTEPRAGQGLLAVLTPAMRTVALAAFGFGVTIGFVEIAVPAAATMAGYPSSVGGLLLSLWSVSSVVAGLLYGLRPVPRPMYLRLPVLLAAFSLLLLLLVWQTSLAGLAIALLVVGTLITPQATAHSIAVDEVAPAGSSTEAFGWVITSVTLGLAAGQSVSGQLIELSGPPLAFAAATVAGLLIAGGVWLRRRTVRDALPAVSPADCAVPAEVVATAR
ncbi:MULTISPECIES: MFS transporter [unclassified Crossiella]|uniref:MFS transporter n=1 Tax=unclassified Crossiella TaxID=2620835 RepID=UPI001FFF0937|nr:MULTISPECIES: MFS transporter [unclassified Crossiella]MCK2237647.1 MFS transporter [Crossiella sp. S99.2]MCK2254933.1 MFS transporter [Crossiella sp. S99.1]